MQTEHVFQIGVSVDDEAIQNSAIKAATDLVVSATTNTLVEKGYGYRGPRLSTTGEELVEKVIKEIVEKNSSMIIEQVISRTVEKLLRSKMLKDKVGEIDA